MKKAKRLVAARARVMLPALLLALPTAAHAQAAADSVNRYVTRELQRRNVPGAAVAVVRNGEVVHAAGYGTANLELNVPVAPDMVFEIGSISKQFTAEAVMLLVEDGKLRLDDRLNDYLPVKPEKWSAITLRQILEHTSGLKDWDTGGDTFYRREYTPAEFIELVSPAPLEFAPGERWAYTNTGFPLLGMVIERASGMPYERFVAERIFRPAGMTSSRFKRTSDVVPRRASGYRYREGAWQNGEPGRPSVIAPNGGVMTTALDMARWQAALFGGRIVRRETLAQMLVPTRLNDGTSPRNHGLGWFMDAFNGHAAAYHPGSTVGGFGAQVYRLVDDSVAVIALTNVEDGGFAADAISKRVANFFVRGTHAAGLPVRPDPDPRTTERLMQTLRDIAGAGDSERIAPELRGRIPASWRDTVAAQLPRMRGLAFLVSETYGPRHWPRGPGTGRVVRYRADVAGEPAFYHFYLDPQERLNALMVERP